MRHLAQIVDSTPGDGSILYRGNVYGARGVQEFLRDVRAELAGKDDLFGAYVAQHRGDDLVQTIRGHRVVAVLDGALSFRKAQLVARPTMGDERGDPRSYPRKWTG